MMGVEGGRADCRSEQHLIGFFWADSVYRSQKIECELEDKGIRSHIHHKGKRGKPLTERQKKANKTRPKVRVCVEHVFGFKEQSMGSKLIHSIGMALF